MSEIMSQNDRLDLALAAELQASLLPKQCPHDCPHQVTAARNRMCRSVGGDFYDFIRVNDDQNVLVIADVVGHGVHASLVMAQIMGYLRSRPASLTRPPELIGELNRMLIDQGERIDSAVLCSMLYVLIDAPTGIGLVINAGHPAPIICNRKECSVIDFGTRNLPMGVEDREFAESCHTFGPPERMVMYTDGLTDAANDKDEHFGRHRLHELISEHVADTPDQCADAIFEAVEQFRNGRPQLDDETIVVIDRV